MCRLISTRTCYIYNIIYICKEGWIISSIYIRDYLSKFSAIISLDINQSLTNHTRLNRVLFLINMMLTEGENERVLLNSLLEPLCLCVTLKRIHSVLTTLSPNTQAVLPWSQSNRFMLIGLPNPPKRWWVWHIHFILKVEI